MAKQLNRRAVLKQSAAAAAACAAGFGSGCRERPSRVTKGDSKRVIIIGCDGMDPRLSLVMMNAGQMPHLDALRKRGGFRPLRTSIPPQSPVAWASFINGPPGPVPTESSTSSTVTRKTSARRFFPSPRRCPAKDLGPLASTVFNYRFGRSTTNHRPRYCEDRECRSGPTWTIAAFPPRSMTFPVTTRPLPANMATTAASRAWALPTCSAASLPISTFPKMVRRRQSANRAAYNPV